MSSRIIQLGFLAILMWSTFSSGIISAELKNPTGKGIFVNQEGYQPEASKRVVSEFKAQSYQVVDESSDEVVFQGKFTQVKDSTSNRLVWQGDFTKITTPGKYYIVIPGVAKSYSFKIEPNIFENTLKLGTRFFYLQRCGVPLNDPETGLQHPVCHPNDATIHRKDSINEAGQVVNAVGGWHDAGDYGKYTTTTTVTAAQILAMVELWPEKFTDGQLQIPESGNGIPDLIDEAKYGLDWLFTMQRADGAVYHKIAGLFWPAFNRPDFDMQKRYVFGFSTADTAKFTAAMAIAARVLKTIDPDYAEKARLAAEKSWQFLLTHPFLNDRSDFDDEGSGAYDSSNDTGDRLWAALEMATLDPKYALNDKMTVALNNHQPSAISWSDASLIGMFHYYCSPYAIEKNKTVIAKKITGLADKLSELCQKSGYNYSIPFKEFGWASNKIGLENGVVFILADRIFSKPEYRKFALAQLDFVLGLNPLSKCYVAKLGTDSVKSPHHRFVAATNKAIPGLLVGGPNNRSESGFEPKNQGPYSYVDAQGSFSSNETAIDYNAALIFLAAAFVDK